MHWIDRIGAELTSRPRFYEPIFAEGWGDLDAIPTDVNPATSPPSVDASVIHRSDSLAIDELKFESPVAGHLPEFAQTVRARVTRPRGARRLVLLFAAFNDHGYDTRSKLVAALAETCTAAVILEAPLYGSRRVRPGQAIATVADLLLLGAGVVSEGVALARWFRAAGWVVGFSGYSMGGSMAAYAAAATDLDVAIAPMAAAHSPSAVYVDAVLSQAVAWDRLGPDGRNRLASVLDSVGTVGLNPPSQAETAVLLAAVDDGYVPRFATERLAEHWPGSTVRWVDGGHASLLGKRSHQVDVIGEAFDRFEAWGGLAEAGPHAAR